MTIFVDTEANQAVCLNITGEKIGTVHGKTVEDACHKLLRHLTKDDTAYVDIHGIGAVTADILSQHINVVSVEPRRYDIINE